ncbi:hypothetical protein BV22DRAFT_1135963 [Leucogyrophana mollusca]|uniref:Uncharacterized protein n=1 Tax=Leucogyrophana mollusca TaxID=85980 RepID=A0ACB8ATQ0_9AGAM|nr:hypothetical protein BV22DRAFT_1135963 [Leucogyrophana mollusca]
MGSELTTIVSISIATSLNFPFLPLLICSAAADNPNAAVPSAAEKSVIEVKLGTVKNKKDTGDTTFKAGDANQKHF